MVQPADQPAACELGENVAQAVVSLARRGRVVEGQQRAGEGLGQEQKDGHAAEDMTPAARCRNLLVEEIADGRLHAGAMVEPAHYLLAEAAHVLLFSVPSTSLPSSSLLPSTRDSYRSRGRGAGPATTL